MNKLSRIIVFVLVVTMLVWLGTILKCEILTWYHGEEFEKIYLENPMMGEIDHFKVLDYSNHSARVYYVSQNRSAGDILIFSRQKGVWKYEKWERTVWSKTGSADGFVWPYIR